MNAWRADTWTAHVNKVIGLCSSSRAYMVSLPCGEPLFHLKPPCDVILYRPALTH